MSKTAKERGYDELLGFNLVNTICHQSGISLEFGSIRRGHKTDYETVILLKLVLLLQLWTNSGWSRLTLQCSFAQS